MNIFLWKVNEYRIFFFLQYEIDRVIVVFLSEEDIELLEFESFIGI